MSEFLSMMKFDRLEHLPAADEEQTLEGEAAQARLGRSSLP